MRKIVAALALGAAVAAAPALARISPEQQLAKLLDGRVAGPPQHCISQHQIRSTQIIDHTAIVYEVGGTRFVNRIEGGNESLDDWKVLVTDTHTDQLCNVDVVRLYDRASHFPAGFVNLGDFVPYTKPDARRR